MSALSMLRKLKEETAEQGAGCGEGTKPELLLRRLLFLQLPSENCEHWALLILLHLGMLSSKASSYIILLQGPELFPELWLGPEFLLKHLLNASLAS